jgi:hypothetical protein
MHAFTGMGGSGECHLALAFPIELDGHSWRHCLGETSQPCRQYEQSRQDGWTSHRTVALRRDCAARSREAAIANAGIARITSASTTTTQCGK